MLPRCVAPPQTIPIDEDHPARNSPIIDPRLVVAPGKDRLQPLHTLIRQPEKVARHHPFPFGSLNHAGRVASSGSMGPDPSRLKWSERSIHGILERLGAAAACPPDPRGRRLAPHLRPRHHRSSEIGVLKKSFVTSQGDRFNGDHQWRPRQRHPARHVRQ